MENEPNNTHVPYMVILVALQVGGFDLLIDQSAPAGTKPPQQQSHVLGCYNDRGKNLKQLKL